MPTYLHWFRRDLRVRDNIGLHRAARDAGRSGRVIGVFVVDTRWWHADRDQLGPFQASFWLESLAELRAALAKRGIPLVVRTSDDPVAGLMALARETGADAITYNKEYEPDQLALDARLARACAAAGLKLSAHKDAAHFEEREILTGGDTTYSVFGPYRRAYQRRLAESPPEPLGLPPPVTHTELAVGRIPSLASLGFPKVTLDLKPGEHAAARALDRFADEGLERYAQTRDTPAIAGTSRLSAHLNAGTLSIRQVLRTALTHHDANETFLTELIWREFYRMILSNHPYTVSEAFNDRYRRVTWTDDREMIAAWCEGRTGYPIVDAAMVQLHQTGFMHNRLRMITAMFLTKDLDVSWTVGERYFRRTLVDYDQASNVGGWQWSASTGTDAAPYFRVMNPETQSRRWDPDGAFIRRYRPALRDVPASEIHRPKHPVVDHRAARLNAIAKFRQASEQAS